MISINNRDASGVYSGDKEIIAIYSGERLVWSKITELKCCYANGYWIDEYPWQDNEYWRD